MAVQPSASLAGCAEGIPLRCSLRRSLAGFIVLALISIALGVLVTDVLLDSGGLRHADNSTVKSLVAERTPFLTDASEVGSTIGGAPLLPILVGAIATRLRLPSQVADCGLRGLCVGCRVGHLQGHVARSTA